MENKIKVYFCNLIKEDLSKNNYLIKNLFFEKELEELFKKKQVVDKNRTIIGRLMIHYSLMKDFQLTYKDIIIIRNNYGKPVLLNNMNNINFNVSHSGNYVVCAISKTNKIGIDIEEVQTFQKQVCELFMTKNELLSYKGSLDDSLVTSIWTMKESYLKAIGTGLLGHINHIEFKKNSVIDIYQVVNKGEAINWWIKLYEINSRYKLSLCMNNINFPNTVTFLDYYNISLNVERRKED
jgi:4'-phosphopantetheinyl transferase